MAQQNIVPNPRPRKPKTFVLRDELRPGKYAEVFNPVTRRTHYYSLPNAQGVVELLCSGDQAWVLVGIVDIVERHS